MLVWHQFILLQETFASAPPYLLSVPLRTCWSYSSPPQSDDEIIALHPPRNRPHSHACYDPLYTPTSQDGGERSERESWKDWDVTRTVSLQSINGLIDIPWAAMFQGERKLIFQALKAWLNVPADDIRKGPGWTCFCWPSHKQMLSHQCNNHVQQKSSLRNVINEQPIPAKPNSDGFPAWFPRAVPWWANLTEISLMNCSASYHRKTEPKHTLLKSSLHFQWRQNESK